jgi:hypothetical protein
MDLLKTEVRRMKDKQKETLEEFDFNLKQVSEMKIPYMDEKISNALDYVKGRAYLGDILERLSLLERKAESIDTFE